MITPCLDSELLRSNCALETSSEACAAESDARAWSKRLCGSRGSTRTSRSPGFTCEPVCTGMSTICPDAFERTSTAAIGVMTPVASTSTTTVCRRTGAVSTTAASAFLSVQAERPASAPAAATATAA